MSASLAWDPLGILTHLRKISICSLPGSSPYTVKMKVLDSQGEKGEAKSVISISSWFRIGMAWGCGRLE